MDEQIPVTRIDRPLLLPVPDKKDGRKGHDFPEDEEGKIVARKNGPEGASHIEGTRHVMPILLNVKGIEGAKKGHDGKNPGKDETQLVNPAEDDSQIQKGITPVDPLAS